MKNFCYSIQITIECIFTCANLVETKFLSIYSYTHTFIQPKRVQMNRFSSFLLKNFIVLKLCVFVHAACISFMSLGKNESENKLCHLVIHFEIMLILNCQKFLSRLLFSICLSRYTQAHINTA